AAGFQFTPDVPEVVDLSVEYDGQGAVRGRHRLGAAGVVEDRQASVAQVHAPGRIDHATVCIRPAVGDAVCHPPEDGFVARADESGDPAHLQVSSGARACTTRA